MEEGQRVHLMGKVTWRWELQLLDALHVHLLHVGGGLHDLVVLQRLEDVLQVCDRGTCAWSRL